MMGRTTGQLWADSAGGVSIMVGAGLPMMLGMVAFAVDVGAITLETRRLQGVADAAAIAAATAPETAQANAEASVTSAGWPRPVTTLAETGSYTADPMVAAASRFTASAGAAEAVRVTVSSPSPTYFARIFGLASVPISRSAIAARERMAAFSIGSRLASVDGGLLNAYLGALTGSQLTLSVASYESLVGVDVDLFAMLGALRTTASLDSVTYDDVLAAEITRGELLQAIAASLDATDPAAASAIRALAGQVSGGSIRLGDLVDAGHLGSQSTGGTELAAIDALQLVTAALQLAAPSRQVALDLGSDVPGIASTRVTIAIGERPAHSPWITITDNGSPVLRTAQARIYAETTVLGTSLPVVGGTGVKLPIFVEMASAEARLAAISCGGSGRHVEIDARPSPGKAAIATIDTALLNDFTQAMPLTSAKLVDTALIDVNGSALIDIGASESWQRLHFSAAQIDAAAPQTVTSASPLSGIASSLASQLTLSLQVAGLPLGLGGLTSAVGSVVGTAAPAIDGLLMLATGSLGVGLGEADVRVTGMRCGTAALVG